MTAGGGHQADRVGAEAGSHLSAGRFGAKAIEIVERGSSSSEEAKNSAWERGVARHPRRWVIPFRRGR
jgi:hypothetical protein